MIYQNPRNLLNFNHNNVYWLMNINQEQRWNDAIFFPSIMDKQQLSLIMQQEQQLLFLAKPHEKVLFQHEPDKQFLSYLEEQGIKLPEIVINKSGNLEANSGFNNAILIPYIQSEETESLKQIITGLKIYGNDFELSKQLNNKYYVRRLMQSHEIQLTRGFFCNSISELEESYSTLRSEGFEKCVVKIPYGSSGKGLHIVNDTRMFRSFLNFISRRAEQFQLLIEGWHPTEKSVNSQLLINEDEVNLLAITEQVIDNQGVYKGTNYTPLYHENVIEIYKAQIINVGKILMELGYRGIVGIDSLIDIQGTIYPVVEINARFTQVTYLLPFVIRMANNFTFIESRYINFETEQKINFHKLRRRMEKIYKSRNKDFIIYTFGFEARKNRYQYRMFVLFVANKILDLNSMIKNFENKDILRILVQS